MMRFLLLALTLGACTPLTFSNDPIDFQKYKSVCVSVSDVDGGESAFDTRHLVDLLRRDSGFTTITADTTQDTDLFLQVDTTVLERETCDSEGDCGIEYTATARFLAVDRAGHTVRMGSEEDTDDSWADAISNALEKVDLQFFRPYRV